MTKTALSQTAHALVDPHCTCNDCMDDFSENKPNAVTQFTFAELLDLLSRAHSVISESEGADENAEIICELKLVSDFVRDEIGGSHMGCAAEEIVLQRSDA